MISSMLASMFQYFAVPRGCSGTFLGLKNWFAYFPNSWFGVTVGSGSNKVTYACDINNNFQMLPTNGQSGLLLIGFAVLDDLIRIAALVAIGYVVYGGIQYVTSQGSPDATAKARQTIINALIGLVVAVMASAIVGFVGNRIG